MWAFAKLWPQSRCTTVFVFTFPTILVRSISLKIILFLGMLNTTIFGVPLEHLATAMLCKFGYYAALLAVQGSCRLQNLYFRCHFACNHQRSESRQIQAKNSEELFQACMVGEAATNPIHISLNTYSQQRYFVVATSNLHNIVQVSSACLQWPWRCGGWMGQFLTHFPASEVAGFGPMQISTSVWALARISEVFCFLLAW